MFGYAPYSAAPYSDPGGFSPSVAVHVSGITLVVGLGEPVVTGIANIYPTGVEMRVTTGIPLVWAAITFVPDCDMWGTITNTPDCDLWTPVDETAETEWVEVLT